MDMAVDVLLVITDVSPLYGVDVLINEKKDELNILDV